MRQDIDEPWTVVKTGRLEVVGSGTTTLLVDAANAQHRVYRLKPTATKKFAVLGKPDAKRPRVELDGLGR